MRAILFLFLGLEDTVKGLITSFLKIILDNKYSSSNDYNAMIIFKGTRFSAKQDVKTKIENNISFSMRQTLKKCYIFPFKNIERSKNKTKKNGGDSHDRIKSLSKEIGVSKDFLDYSNQTNTNLPNIVISTNSTKQASKNIRHEPNNNIACNQNDSVNIDIPTKLNINIPSNQTKVNVGKPTQLNINIHFNP